MEKKNKIRKNYRINPFVCEQMKRVLEKLRINETSFVEMAIIEKIARIQAKNEQGD